MRSMHKFTFHHVSIKTEIEQIKEERKKNLHSTMYLLKRISRSIRDFVNLIDLHSTMYLLKPTNSQ